jgi:hypothetical protein
VVSRRSQPQAVVSLTGFAMQGMHIELTAHLTRFDQDTAARANFFNTTSQWYSSWPSDPKERGMAVKSVNMWQKC